VPSEEEEEPQVLGHAQLQLSSFVVVNQGFTLDELHTYAARVNGSSRNVANNP
jgi:hypothetical protein